MKIQQKIAIAIFRTKINILALVSKRKAAEEAFRLFSTPMMKTNIKERPIFKTGEPLEFKLNGKRISGFRFNHPGKNKVLILHGFSSNCHNFEKYITPLLEKNYEVLSFDAPAHGASEGKTVNAVDYCNMIRKVIELYGPIQGYLAHSFGGIALSLAMETTPHDEHTKIVLIAPATETTSAVDGAFAMLGIKDAAIRSFFDEIIYNISGKDTDWFSIRRAMNHIKASVLWFHDEDDDITPICDALEVKKDAHPNIHFMISKGLGHRKIYRDENVVNAAVKFL